MEKQRNDRHENDENCHFTAVSGRRCLAFSTCGNTNFPIQDDLNLR